MKSFLLLVIGLASFFLTSCPEPEPHQPVGPEGQNSIPWNRPAPGEGAGALQQVLQPY